MKRKVRVPVLLFSLALFFAFTHYVLASSGGGNQIYYPVTGGVSETALVDSNLWIAMDAWDAPLIWANSETGRWAPQNRNASSLDAYGQDLWVLGGGEVSLYDGNSWTSWSTLTAQAQGTGVQIQVDNAGFPWFVSDSAISRYNGVDWERVATGPAYPHWASYKQIAPVSSNEAWVAYREGLLHITGGVTQTFTTADGLVSNDMVAVTYDDVNGDVWAGSYDSGISYGDGTSWTTVTTGDGLLSNQIRDLHGGGGTIWVAYSDVPGSVSRYVTAGGWSHLNLPAEYSSQLLTYVSSDASTTLWAGLEDGTVLRYVEPGGTWSIAAGVNGPADYTTNRVFSVTDTIYSNGYQGTSRFDGSTWESIPEEYTTGANLENGFWLSAPGYLYHSADGSSWDAAYLGSDVRVTRIISDTQSGHLWLGTESGLWEYDPVAESVVNTWNPADEVSVAGNYVKDLEVTADGDVWLIAGQAGYSGTAVRFDPSGDTWSAYDTGTPATGVAQTSMGELWFATEVEYTFVPQFQVQYGSLVSFDGSTWSVYTQTHGLPWFTVGDVAIDAMDQVWTTGWASGAPGVMPPAGFAVWDGVSFTTHWPMFDPAVSASEIWLDQATGDIWTPTSPSGVLRFNSAGLVSSGEILTSETTIESQDGSGLVTFPSGSLPTGTAVDLVSMPAEDSGNLKGQSPILETSWSTETVRLQTAGTYTITLSYIAPDLGPFITGTLDLYQWNTDLSLWENISSTHDAARMEFSAVVSGPGRLQIMGATYDVYLPMILRQ